MRILLVLSALGVSLAAVPVSAQQASKCAPPDDVSRYMLNKLKSLMQATSGSRALSRERARIPVVDTATITLVTDKTTCSKAEQAYTTALSGNTSTPSGKVHVVRVGTVFVVVDPGRKGGGYYAELVMDNRFRVLARYLT